MLSEEKIWRNVRKLYRRLGIYKVDYDFKYKWLDVLKWGGARSDGKLGIGFSRITYRTELQDANDYVYGLRYRNMLELKNEIRQRAFIIPPGNKKR